MQFIPDALLIRSKYSYRNRFSGDKEKNPKTGTESGNFDVFL